MHWGASSPGEGGREWCIHLDDESQVANYIEETVDNTPL